MRANVNVRNWHIVRVIVIILSFLCSLQVNPASAQGDITVTDVSDYPDSFSPNSDNQYDNNDIYFSLSMDAFVTLQIYDSNQVVVRTLLDHVAKPVGYNEISWDGKDANGAVVPDGLYTYTIDAIDGSGNSAVQQTGDVLVDTRSPLTIISPTPGSTLSGTVEVVASQPDDYSIYPYNGYTYFYVECPNTSASSDMPTRQPDGTWTASLNTTTVLNGACQLRARVNYTDSRGQGKQVWVLLGSYTIDNGLEIRDVNDYPDSFSPNADGYYDDNTIYFALSETARITIRIYNNSHTLIRSLLQNALKGAGSNQVTWDGKDASGVVVPDGLYSYTIDAVDGSGNSAVQQTGDILVDTRSPLTIVSPTPGSTLSGTVDVVASQPDDYTIHAFNYFTYFTIECATSSSNVVMPSQQLDGTWAASLDTTTVLNGPCQIKSRVNYTDSRGEGKQVVVSLGTYTVDNGLEIRDVNDYPDSFSPNADGYYDNNTIYFSLSADAFVTLQIHDSNQVIVRTLLDNVAKPVGYNEIIWNGKDANGAVVPDGLYSYTIDAVDGSGNSAVQQTGDILVDTRSPLTIISPTPGSTLSGTVQVIASQPDDYTIHAFNYFTYFTIECATSSSNVVMPSQQLDGTWAASLDTTTVLNGPCQIKSRVNYTDSRGEGKQVVVSLGTYTVDNGLDVRDVNDYPDSFSPNADGYYDNNTIYFSLSADAFVTLQIHDSNQVIVRTLLDNVAKPVGYNEIIWNGKDANGAVVPDGLYSYTIDAVDGSGNSAVQQTGDVLVDTRNPIELSDPTVGTIVVGTVTLTTVPVSGYDIRHADLYGINPSGSWYYISSGIRQADGTWVFEWNTTELSNGQYEIRSQVQYYDSRSSYKNLSSTLGNLNVLNGVAPGHITGQVFDNFNSPIAGALIEAEFQACSACLPFSTLSGEDGTYSLDLIPGNYYVQASKGEYVGEYFNDASLRNAATVITVAEGETNENIDFALARLGVISGTVRDTGGNPIQGARIQAIDNSGRIISSSSNPDGTYTIFGLPTGQYRLNASKLGFITEYYLVPDGTTDPNLASLVSVNLDTVTTEIDFSLARPGSISGVVEDAEGSTIATAAVQLLNMDCSGITSLNVNSRGGYIFIDVGAGSYKLRASAEGFQSEYFTGAGGATDCASAEVINVSATGLVEGIDFSLVKFGSITGKILDSNNAPLQDVQIRYWSSTCEDCFGDYTSSDGSYTIPNLVPGGYRLQAVKTDYVSEYWTSTGGTQDFNNAEVINVADGVATADIDFALQRIGSGSISGTVIDDLGTPIQDVQITATYLTYTRTATTDASGGFTFADLHEGTWNVSVEDLEGYVKPASQSIHVTPGQTAQVEFIYSRIPVLRVASDNLSTTVTAGQQSIRSFVIENIGHADANNLAIAGPESISWITVDPQSMASLSPGETVAIQVQASPALETMQGTYLDRITIDAANITEQLNVDISVIVVPAESGSLSVTVRDQDGNPLSGATVSLLSHQLSANFSYGNEGYYYETIPLATTDANGETLIQNLPIGDFAYSVSASNHLADTGVLNIPEAGGTTSYVSTLELSPFDVEFTVEPIPFEQTFTIITTMRFEAELEAPSLIPNPLDIYITENDTDYDVEGTLYITNPSRITVRNVTLEWQPDLLQSLAVDISLGEGYASSSITIDEIAPQTTISVPYKASYHAFFAMRGLVGQIEMKGDYLALGSGGEIETFHVDPSYVGVYVTPQGAPPSTGDTSGIGGGGGGGTCYCVSYGTWSGVSFPRLPFFPPSRVRVPIVIQLTQNGSLEGEAFRGTLRVTNSLSEPLTGFSATIEAYDLNGTDVTSQFYLDGGASGISIPSGQQNTSTWTIVPGDGLGGSPTGTGLDYRLRARIDYQISGRSVTLYSEQAVIHVNPQPALYIDYYLPRQVQANIPFRLTAVIRNEGGIARNFTVESGQPRIVENVSGALVNFQVIGAGIDGVSSFETNSLIVNFGDINASSTVTVYWLMTVDADGEFTDFSASYTTNNSLGLPIPSPLRDVRAHIYDTAPISGIVSDGHGHTLNGVFVGLLEGDDPGYVTTTTTDSSGGFSFFISRPSLTYKIVVELRDINNRKRILYGANQDLVKIQTPAFSAGSGDYVTKDIEFTNTSVLSGNIPNNKLDDLAAIYYRIYQVEDFIVNQLHEPRYEAIERIWGFDPQLEPAGAWYIGTAIEINQNISGYWNLSSPKNREWHEYSHHLMNLTVGLPTRQEGEDNHNGYDNESTRDSWAEGWAEFWPCVIDDYNGSITPSLYGLSLFDTTSIPLIGNSPVPVNLEWNYQVWDSPANTTREEFAVASLLWDLYDGKNVPIDQDSIDLSLHDLWNVIGYDSDLQPLETMKDVYDKFHGLANEHELFNEDGSEITAIDIDQVFISHGFYADTCQDASCTHSREDSEEVGWGGRSGRMNTPLVPNAYIKVNVADSEGNAVTGSVVNVRMIFEQSYYNYDVTTVLDTSNENLIYVEPPPSRVPVVIELQVSADAVNSEVISFSNSEYWAKVGNSNNGFADELTFTLQQNSPPNAATGGPYSVNEGEVTILTGSGNDPNGDVLTYNWDLNNDHLFEAPGRVVEFSALAIDGPATRTVTLKVCDPSEQCDTDTTSVTINNAEPVLHSGADQYVSEAENLDLTEITFTDAGTFDTHAATIIWGDGSSDAGNVTEDHGAGTITGSHEYFDNGDYQVQICVTDDDGAIGCDLKQVIVNNVIPTVELGSDVSVENGLLDMTRSFMDPGADTWTATVDFGDGSGLELLALNPDKSFSLVHHYQNEGIYTFQVCVIDDDGGEGCDTATVTNFASSTNTSLATLNISVQYSDAAIIEAKLTLSSGVPVDAADIEFDVPGICNGTSSTDSEGIARFNCGPVTSPVGEYPISVYFAGEEPRFLDASTASATLSVLEENTSITFDDGNPLAIRVQMPRGNSGVFTFIIHATERDLDSAANPSLASPGDLNQAEIRLVLQPVGPGTSVQGTCAKQVIDTGYDATLSAVCTFSHVPVNTYLAVTTIDGIYYTGSNEAIVTIFDPALRNAAGAGWFYWPGTQEKTYFGLTVQYDRKGRNAQGGFVLIRYLADGTTYRVESTTLFAPSIGILGSGAQRYGWASLSGKATYQEPDWVEPIGNHEFAVYLEDRNEPGNGTDQFWLQIKDQNGNVIAVIAMPQPASENTQQIEGGNVVVPHTSK